MPKVTTDRVVRVKYYVPTSVMEMYNRTLMKYDAPHGFMSRFITKLLKDNHEECVQHLITISRLGQREEIEDVDPAGD